jgi:hypothetical protein
VTTRFDSLPAVYTALVSFIQLSDVFGQAAPNVQTELEPSQSPAMPGVANTIWVWRYLASQDLCLPGWKTCTFAVCTKRKSKCVKLIRVITFYYYYHYDKDLDSAFLLSSNGERDSTMDIPIGP